MPDIWFVAGIALGTIVTGFCAIGSFERGTDSARRQSWSREYNARRRAFVASRNSGRATHQLKEAASKAS
jgi:hypothetical protein